MKGGLVRVRVRASVRVRVRVRIRVRVRVRARVRVRVGAVESGLSGLRGHLRLLLGLVLCLLLDLVLCLLLDLVPGLLRLGECPPLLAQQRLPLAVAQARLEQRPHLLACGPHGGRRAR